MSLLFLKIPPSPTDPLLWLTFSPVIVFITASQRRAIRIEKGTTSIFILQKQRDVIKAKQRIKELEVICCSNITNIFPEGHTDHFHAITLKSSCVLGSYSGILKVFANKHDVPP